MHTTTQDKRAGQSIVEISLLLALVSITALVGLNLVGVNLKAVLCRIATGLDAGANCAPIIASAEPPAAPPASGGPIKMEDFCQGRGVESNLSFKPVAANDYTVSFKQTIDTKSQGAGASAGSGHNVFFRATKTGSDGPNGVGSLNGYSLRYTPPTTTGKNSTSASLAIVKWTAGNRVTPDLETLTLPDGYGASNNIELTVSGDTFRVMIDGKEFMQVKDTTYTTGGIGFHSPTPTGSTQTCFNNVLIQPLD
ncbi:hypothetical protein EYB53_020045 [Candidatus Chloroploca sp. M-50]|uniref:3-keto-disaccharide hydrolase domain-containing protein n=1 Tax=Candidatus Chloroploca mongolica TaxID=2528176 RepID=A0ABS4DEY9_9CHLR|nr:hypothetical protein [Candidatus Chloroploca mongolica]MBP1468020.1 hypothetical protein [Candidatus Chloroploca mongolica]